MKFSIAVLSSILAVCSVTIANPVDPSSTMSAEASTSTASSSITSTGEVLRALSPSTNVLGGYCDRLDTTELSLMEEIAKARVKSVKAFKLLEDRRFELVIQTGLLTKEREDLENMIQAPSRKLSSAQDNYEESRQRCIRLQYTVEDYVSRLSDRTEESKELAKKLTSYSSFGVTPDGDDGQPKSFYVYQDCFKYFYNRLSQ
ncbi:hypothetical protein O5D80_007209 [Batrachochytrium dendrobatidis]|nr:hypothetical protein O5D80_007209 [Batrachochytrium dendrobatidis]